MKESVLFVFRNVLKSIPVILFISAISGAMYGVTYAVKTYVFDHFLLNEILIFITSFIGLFGGMVHFVFYLNQDWLENQDAYEMVEEI